MLALNDGRSELWQWDTGRKLTVDADCSQVHFSNKVFGRSIDVDVVDGIAVIPDILLQTEKDLTAWAFVGTAENGYTKISKVFKVNKRNKPANYVFTPQDQSTLGEILDRIEDLENRPSGDVSKEDIQNAVNDYLDKNPVSFEEKDPTVPDWAKQPEKPKYTAAEVGALPADTVIPEGVTDEQIKDVVDAYLTENPPEVSGGGRMSFKTKISIAESTAGFALDQIDGQPFCFRRMVVVIESICASTTSNSSNTWLNPIVNNKSFQGLQYAVGQNASKVTAFEFEAFADDVDFAKVFCAATSANREGLFDVWRKTAPMTVQGAGITSIMFTMGDNYTTFENGTVFYIFAEEL